MFSTLFKQIKDVVDLSDLDGVLYTEERMIKVMYKLVKCIGVFKLDCCKWCKISEAPPQQRIWMSFQAFSQKAHKYWDIFCKGMEAQFQYGQDYGALTTGLQYE